MRLPGFHCRHAPCRTCGAERRSALADFDRFGWHERLRHRRPRATLIATRPAFGQHLGLQCVGHRRAAVHIGDGLVVGVTHDIAAGDLLGFPRWWESAGRLICRSLDGVVESTSLAAVQCRNTAAARVQTRKRPHEACFLIVGERSVERFERRLQVIQRASTESIPCSTASSRPQSLLSTLWPGGRILALFPASVASLRDHSIRRHGCAPRGRGRARAWDHRSGLSSRGAYRYPRSNARCNDCAAPCRAAKGNAQILFFSRSAIRRSKKVTCHRAKSGWVIVSERRHVAYPTGRATPTTIVCAPELRGSA